VFVIYIAELLGLWPEVLDLPVAVTQNNNETLLTAVSGGALDLSSRNHDNLTNVSFLGEMKDLSMQNCIIMNYILI